MQFLPLTEIAPAIQAHVRTLRNHEHRLTVYDGQAWGELYDLKNDPLELRNLWNDGASQALRARLMEALVQSLMAAADTSPYPAASA